MRDIYVKELEDISNKLAEQTTAVVENYRLAIQSLNQADETISARLQESDLKINQMAVDIEKEAYRLVALQQPVAEDLRLIFTVMSVSDDLERIGDHAVLIAKNVKRSSDDAEVIESLVLIINQMAEKTFEMLDQVQEALATRDAQKARLIADQDELVDAGLKRLYKESSSRMESNPEAINPGVNYIAIGNSVERIGDYITNICERIVYLTEASMVDLNR